MFSLQFFRRHFLYALDLFLESVSRTCDQKFLNRPGGRERADFHGSNVSAVKDLYIFSSPAGVRAASILLSRSEAPVCIWDCAAVVNQWDFLLQIGMGPLAFVQSFPLTIAVTFIGMWLLCAF